MKNALTIFGIIVGLTYPILVFLSLQHVSLPIIAAGLALLGTARLISAGQNGAALKIQGLAILLFAALLAARGETSWLRYYPVLMNGAMLAMFAASLRWPPSIIERLARISEPNLPESGVRYTKRVTQIWCIFFFANGVAALWTARFSSWEFWTLYNGFISYILMGVLFTSEWLVRQRMRRNLV
jgi:uncharacterized membrane protein